MTLEDRLRLIVDALPAEASVTLPVTVLRVWLNDDGDDPLDDLTVAHVATKLGRSEGTVRAWIRAGDLDAYTLGREYRITRPALASFRLRRRDPPSPPEPSRSSTDGSGDLGAWREVRATTE
jgi:excisionase family DNA binding protein